MELLFELLLTLILSASIALLLARLLSAAPNPTHDSASKAHPLEKQDEEREEQEKIIQFDQIASTMKESLQDSLLPEISDVLEPRLEAKETVQHHGDSEEEDGKRAGRGGGEERATVLSATDFAAGICSGEAKLADELAGGEQELKDGLGDGNEDGWEGIERSEVEKSFGTALAFTASVAGAEAVIKLSSDVQLRLHGLLKVATEGPCHEPQPLTIMPSSRAKWLAWQKLGMIMREEAMEQYVTLLSESIPGWIGDRSISESTQQLTSPSQDLSSTCNESGTTN